MYTSLSDCAHTLPTGTGSPATTRFVPVATFPAFGSRNSNANALEVLGVLVNMNVQTHPAEKANAIGAKREILEFICGFLSPTRFTPTTLNRWTA
jgi:hypothetical protein